MNREIPMDKVIKLVEPIVTGLNYELYHVEFVKESGENYLRIYIDSDNGIGLNDCEKVSRPISDMLDVEDPISSSYYLEVSSPGINRRLYSDRHLLKYTGYDVNVKLSSLLEGKRSVEGKLAGYAEDSITISNEQKDLVIQKSKISNISLKGEL